MDGSPQMDMMNNAMMGCNCMTGCIMLGIFVAILALAFLALLIMQVIVQNKILKELRDNKNLGRKNIT
jgi:hypothetical protein